jgi:hypothetical protein
MKTKTKTQSNPFTGPLLAELVQQDKANKAANFPAPSVGEQTIPAPDLYQDSGSGYNAGFVFPQN